MKNLERKQLEMKRRMTKTHCLTHNFKFVTMPRQSFHDHAGKPAVDPEWVAKCPLIDCREGITHNDVKKENEQKAA